MIALDGHGADRGPAAVAEGAALAGTGVLLFGPRVEVRDPVQLVESPQAIAAEEDPVRVVRAKPEASIVRAAQAVAAGRADALVSAGPTGATLAASVVHVKRLRGVHRPAIAVLLPLTGRPTLLLDAGASTEVRPEHLVQFGYLGAAFMEAVEGIERPRVGLLSVGEEPGKGTPDVVAAHERLAAGSLDFVGNVEGRDLTAGGCDVVVTDGFTGNVALKTIEGTALTVAEAIRQAIRSDPVSALGGLLVRRKLGRLRRELDPNEVGGAILLGLRRVVVIAHGSSSPEGVARAVQLARRAVDERMIERTASALERGGALRPAPAASVSDGHDTG